ncbi:glucuronidase 3 [Striga asiatica]|uniref:Glucuronidase 3 n=1 Tax=Striga asiatica TaxID=4170 RepID=A0A5A7PY96_STRAF|nr:glucuronidase 3 [Striga asiatica]
MASLAPHKAGWRVLPYVIIIIYLSFVCCTKADGTTRVHGTVVIDGKRYIAETDENFVCATLDWWPADKCDYGTCSWGNSSILNLDLKNPILFNAIKGNELGGRPILGVAVGANPYVNDTSVLGDVIKEIYKGSRDKPLVIAPGGIFEPNWFSSYIPKMKGILDVITHHTYPVGSGADTNLMDRILNATALDEVVEVFSGLYKILKESRTSTVAWIGESGGVYNSGRDGITNTFLFSFWYLDSLGIASIYDTKVYCRQTLVGGNYGLLDTTTFVPNPDYYSALLWHRLMGKRVLRTRFKGTKNIRAYTHCAKPSKGITVLLINLDGKTKFHVKLDFNTTYPHSSKLNSEFDGEKLYREEYHLSPMDGNIQSRTVLLNHKALIVDSNGTIPALKPLRVASSKHVTVHPHTIVFVHIANVSVHACK